MLFGLSRTTAIFATASVVTHPVWHNAATSAFPAISSMVLKPCVRLPTLQFPWSSATVANTPCVPSIQKTQLAATAPVRPSAVAGGYVRSIRPIPAGTWLIKAMPTGGTASPNRSCRSRCQVSKRLCDMCPSSRSDLRAFTRGEAQKEYGSVERAVGDSPPRLLSEAVEQLPTDLTGLGGGVSAARQQSQQVVGRRRLHVAVRLDRLHAEPRCGDESGKPPHDVGGMHHIPQHRAYGRLQGIAIEQSDSDRCEVAVENDELPARLENPARLGQRSLRVGQVRVDRVRDNKVEGGVRLAGCHSVAECE